MDKLLCPLRWGTQADSACIEGKCAWWHCNRCAIANIPVAIADVRNYIDKLREATEGRTSTVITDSSQNDAEQPMWEYRVELSGGESRQHLQLLLNRLGRQGWELCGVPVGRTDGAVLLPNLYIFKRNRMPGEDEHRDN